MILVLTALFILVIVFLLFNEFTDKHTYLFTSIIASSFIVVASFRPSFLDYQVYVDYFYSIDDIFIEPSFYFLVKIFRFFNLGYIFLFIFFAVLGVLLKLIAIKISSKYIYYSLLIYLSYYFILHELVQIRVGVACGFFLLALHCLQSENKKHFLFYSFLAILFHYSAIIILPLIFLSSDVNKKVYLYIIPFSYLLWYINIGLFDFLAFATRFFPQLHDRIMLYELAQLHNSYYVNVFSIPQLFNIFVFYILLNKIDIIKTISPSSIILLKIFCFSIIALPLLSQVADVSFRINQFLGVVGILIIPMMIDIFKEKHLLKTSIILYSLFIFIYNSNLYLNL
jgi:hypothetical protein